MSDLRERFAALDAVEAPDLWPEVLRLALDEPPRPRRWAPLIAAAAVLVAVVVPTAAIERRDRAAEPAGPEPQVVEPVQVADGEPFAAVIAFLEPGAEITATFQYRDATTWRLEYLPPTGPGTDPTQPSSRPVVVADGERVTTLDSVAGTVTAVPVAGTPPPGALMWTTSRTERGERCHSPVPRPAVDGRSVVRYSCDGPNGPVAYDVDVDSGLVLEARVAGAVVQRAERVVHQPRFAEDAFVAPRPKAAAPFATELRPDAEVGRPLPSWRLPRLDADGTLSSADLRGRPSVVLFWASWCAPCTGRTGIAALDGLAAQRPTVHVAAVATAEARARAEEWLATHPTRLPVAFDTGERASQSWGLRGYPTFYVLDADGGLLGVAPNASTADDLVRFVDALTG